MTTVLLMGKAGAGKDTAANIIVENYENIHTAHFAYVIKNFGLKLGFSYESLYGTQKEKCLVDAKMGVSGRHFMEKFGMLMREHSGEILGGDDTSIWTRALKNHISHTMELDPKINFVITDGRFLNEAELVRSMDGIIIKLISCDEYEETVKLYESERELSQVEADYTIVNDPKNRNLETLRDDLFRVLDIHLTRKTKSYVGQSWMLYVFILMFFVWLHLAYNMKY